jgi:GT2 family glycosyltransferase
MNVMIILNYNDFITTETYIKLIANYSSIDKIVVVDNCSKDDSYSRLLHYSSDKIDIIKTDKNEGYAKGNNFGINFALSKYPEIKTIIISNPDIIVDNNTILNLENKLVRNNLFAITSIIKDANNNLTRNFAWKHTSYFNHLLACSSFLQVLFRVVFSYTKFYKKPISNYEDNLMIVDNLPGCFFIVDAKKWQNIGGFDEGTFLYYEEDILFKKASKEGYLSAIDLDTSLQHLQGVSIAKSIKKFSYKEKVNRENCEYFLINFLGVGKTRIMLYRILNIILLPERFIYLKIKNI